MMNTRQKTGSWSVVNDLGTGSDKEPEASERFADDVDAMNDEVTATNDGVDGWHVEPQPQTSTRRKPRKPHGRGPLTSELVHSDDDEDKEGDGNYSLDESSLQEPEDRADQVRSLEELKPPKLPIMEIKANEEVQDFAQPPSRRATDPSKRRSATRRESKGM